MNNYYLKDTLFDLEPQLNGCCLLSKVSVNYDFDHFMMPLFCTDAVPYEDIIPDADIVYEVYLERN